MTSIIRKRAKECLEQYKLLIGINEEMGSVSHDVNMLENRFARFKIWAGHVGVFADGPCLLDRRLHESTQILMLQFLTSLLEKIHNGKLESLFSPDLFAWVGPACYLSEDKRQLS
jgi:hypothetical protein